MAVISEGWNGFSVLHTAASRVGGLDLGFVPGQGGLDAAAIAKAGALDLLFNLGADEIDDRARRLRRLYRHAWRQGRASRRRHPAGRGLYRKIRPLREYGRPRAGWPTRAAFPPGDAREDWAILRALSGALGTPLPFDSLAAAARASSARRIRICASSTRSSPARPRDLEALALQPATAWKDAFRLRDRRFLSHQSDRARLGRRWRNVRRWRRAG